MTKEAAWQKAAESVHTGQCECSGSDHASNCGTVAAVLPWVEKCEELERQLREALDQIQVEAARADAAEKRCKEVEAWLRERDAHTQADRLDPREG